MVLGPPAEWQTAAGSDELVGRHMADRWDESPAGLAQRDVPLAAQRVLTDNEYVGTGNLAEIKSLRKDMWIGVFTVLWIDYIASSPHDLNE